MADEEYIKQQYQTLSYSNDQFDKNILFIASGALGISFGFIEQLVPDLAATVHKCYLIDSWYCFGGVIFISLVAHFISVLANTWAIEKGHLEASRYNIIRRRWNYTIRGFNIVMIVGLLSGILLLIAFVKQNL